MEQTMRGAHHRTTLDCHRHAPALPPGTSTFFRCCVVRQVPQTFDARDDRRLWQGDPRTTQRDDIGWGPVAHDGVNITCERLTQCGITDDVDNDTRAHTVLIRGCRQSCCACHCRLLEDTPLLGYTIPDIQDSLTD